MPTPSPTRRELLGLSLGSALGAAGGSLLGAVPVLATSPQQTDPQIVSALLESEQLAVFAYLHVLHTGLLSDASHRAVRPMLGHERTHNRVLTSVLLRLGGTPPRSQLSVANADKLLTASRQPSSLTQLRNEHDAILLLIRLEFALEGFYYAAMSKLQDTHAVGTLAQVMANEAQHASVLSELIRPGNVNKAVPSAFVQG
jgi:Ferritin-like domain